MHALNAQQSSQFMPTDSWIVDSRASHHMTADVNVLTQVAPYEENEKITIGNGTSIPIKNIGYTILRINGHSLLLNHVLHVQKIARSLMSIDNKSWFKCDQSNFFYKTRR